MTTHLYIYGQLLVVLVLIAILSMLTLMVTSSERIEKMAEYTLAVSVGTAYSIMAIYFLTS